MEGIWETEVERETSERREQGRGRGNKGGGEESSFYLNHDYMAILTKWLDGSQRTV